MALLSTELANAWLDGSALTALLTDFKGYVYSGTAPATADAAVPGGATLLGTIASGGSALNLAATPADGAIGKDGATWTLTGAATGTAAFVRFCLSGDDGSAAATAGDYRVQASVGTVAAGTAELQLQSTSITGATSAEISTFELVLPVGGA